MKRLTRTVWSVVASIVISCVASGEELEPEAKIDVKFYYEVFPPYIYSENGELAGSVIELTKPILRKAGLRLNWQPATFSRIIRDIDRSSVPVCAAGYSTRKINNRPFYASKPYAWIAGVSLVILRENKHLFDPYSSIADIMSDTRLRGGFLQDANYLGITGAPIESGRERHILIGGSDTDLANMVVRERIHFAPVTAPQVAYFKATGNLFRDLEVLTVSGLRGPRPVGLICSEGIGEAAWNRIEKAVPPLMPYDEYVALYLSKWSSSED